jgi:hypothetical protein
MERVDAAAIETSGLLRSFGAGVSDVITGQAVAVFRMAG